MNRFHPSSEILKIRGTTEGGGRVSLVVRNILGQAVCEVSDWEAGPGEVFQREWKGCNSSGETVGSGIYLVVLSGDGRPEVRKVMVLRD